MDQAKKVDLNLLLEPGEGGVSKFSLLSGL